MHLRKPEPIYGACGPFTKNKEKIRKRKQTGDSQYISQIIFNRIWLMKILKI